MAEKVLDYYSSTTIPIRLHLDSYELSIGTGFFYHRHGRTYLVSNWHVFSGRNAYTGQPLSSSAAIPNRISTTLNLKDQVGAYSDGRIMPILTSEGDPIWMQHQLGQEIDIAVVRMAPEFSEKYVSHSVAPSWERSDMAVSVGTEVFILGYPKGLAKQGPLPVWKRGTIATEPEVDIDDKRVFLVDSLSKGGMSGAPVLARASSQFRSTNGSIVTTSGTSTKFLGVYSGRFGGNENDVQLGRVWHRTYLDEIIDNPAPGSYQLRKAGD